MYDIIKATSRGLSRHSWLDSFHSFSFANYYNRQRMGISHLRVINDDTIEPGKGFGTHPHQNMEIITYVLEGKIEHRDTQGNISRLGVGEIQLMSAGRGISHSEYNASSNEKLKLLQIWIEPETLGGKPSYQQKRIGKSWGLTTLVSPNGVDGSLTIKQQATIYQLLLKPNQQKTMTIEAGQNIYIHLISGELNIENNQLSEGDGIHIKKQETITLTASATKNLQALVFKLE